MNLSLIFSHINKKRYSLLVFYTQRKEQQSWFDAMNSSFQLKGMGFGLNETVAL